MDDGLAREGVLTRCNENRDETLTDEECANARRAAAAIALEAERARAPQLEQESEAKLLAMRDREGRQAAAEQDAGAAPAFGAPLGTVMPSMTASSFDVYAEGADPLGRRTLEVAAAEPPPNECRHRVAAARDDGSRGRAAAVPRRYRLGNSPRLRAAHSRGNVTASSLLGEAGLPLGATTDGAPGSTAAVRSASRNGRAAAGVSTVCAPSGTPLVFW